ncbi:hypothetical protein [Sphingomonas sp. BK069]|uniref:hypothetical protein n=1 Tax=Sphingomonas sp. BK069 TaxID=2586979 RepID=UPI001611665E|nr:hypothetical protein [Sphingomonas sp. BK069]MBB3349448.1 hypothetical protein [Sphingomonas sp. BK069]
MAHLSDREALLIASSRLRDASARILYYLETLGEIDEDEELEKLFSAFVPEMIGLRPMLEAACENLDIVAGNIRHRENAPSTRDVAEGIIAIITLIGMVIAGVHFYRSLLKRDAEHQQISRFSQITPERSSSRVMPVGAMLSSAVTSTNDVADLPSKNFGLYM